MSPQQTTQTWAALASAVLLGAVVGLAASSAAQPAQLYTAVATPVTSVAATRAPVMGAPLQGFHASAPYQAVPQASYAAPSDEVIYDYEAPAAASPGLSQAWTVGAFGAVGALAAYFFTRKSTADQLPLLGPVAMAATTGEMGRREAMASAVGASFMVANSAQAKNQGQKGGLPDAEVPVQVICDEACAAALANQPRVKTASGLEYQDIKVGTGPGAAEGFQVTFSLVATLPDSNKIFINTFTNGKPIDARVGTDSMVKGLDEGLSTMKVGGIRRIYCPGNLSYTTGLRSAPGQPAVPAKTPVIFDVELLLVPGLDEEPEEDFQISF